MKISKLITDKKFILIDKDVFPTENPKINKLISKWKHTRTNTVVTKVNEFNSEFKTINLRLVDDELIRNEVRLVDSKYNNFLIPK